VAGHPYYWTNTASATGIHVATNEVLASRTTTGSATLTSGNLAASADELAFCATSASGEPNVATWVSGTYSCVLNVSAIGSGLTLGLATAGGSVGHFGRVNTGLTADVDTNVQAEALFSGTGVHTATYTGAFTGSTASDRYEALVGVVRDGVGHGNQTVSITVGTITEVIFWDGFEVGPTQGTFAGTSDFSATPYFELLPSAADIYKGNTQATTTSWVRFALDTLRLEETPWATDITTTYGIQQKASGDVIVLGTFNATTTTESYSDVGLAVNGTMDDTTFSPAWYSSGAVLGGATVIGAWAGSGGDEYATGIKHVSVSATSVVSLGGNLVGIYPYTDDVTGFFNCSGTTALGTSYTEIALDTTELGSVDYTLATNQITINTTGTYLILYRATWRQTASVDTAVTVALFDDTGGSFAAVAGSEFYAHSGYNSKDAGQTSAIIADYTSGDKLSLRALADGASRPSVLADFASVIIMRIPAGATLFSGYEATAATPSATYTAVDMDTEISKNGVTHSTSTAPSEVTIDETGTYLIIGSFSAEDNATSGTRHVNIAANLASAGWVTLANAKVGASSYNASGIGGQATATTVIALELAAADKIRLEGQSTGTVGLAGSKLNILRLDNFNSLDGQDVAVGQATEADTAQTVTPVAGTVTTSVGQATELDTAQAITPSAVVTIAIGQAGELDTAQAITVVPGTATISVGQAAELDTAQTVIPTAPATISVGQAAELDTAQSVTPVATVTIAVGQASELDTAQVVTPVAGTITVVLGQATELDTAQSVTPSAVITVTLGQAAEADTAHSVAPVATSTVILGQASELDTAQTITPAVGTVTVVLGQASEADTAQTVTPTIAQVIAVGQASELDTAQAVTWTLDQIVAVVQVSEADTAQVVVPVAGTITITLGQASELDTAQLVTPVSGTTVAVGQVSEADTAQTVTPVATVSIAVGQAAELDTAQAVVATSTITITLGQATEADTALAVVASAVVSIAVGQALEADTAQSITAVAGTVTITLGQATELDTAQTVTPLAGATVIMGQAAEADTAQAVTPVTGAVTVAVGQAAELDTAQSIVAAPGAVTVALGQASELDTAHVVTSVAGTITVTVGQAAELDTAQAVTFASSLSIAVGQALEADTAQAVTAVPGVATVTLGQAQELDTAQTVTPLAVVSVAVGQASEADTALALTAVAGAVSVVVGQASEADIAKVATPLLGLYVVVGQASEANTAQVVVAVGGPTSISVGLASEADTAQGVSAVIGGTGQLGYTAFVGMAVLYGPSLSGGGADRFVGGGLLVVPLVGKK
jgi:hypothetical protein